ncbi:hypothetical protein EC973_008397, partial [Apophysomyces ossiformis]
MGLKGVHAYLRQEGATTTANIPHHLRQYQVGIVYVDFCCDFFWLLQDFAVDFLTSTSDRRQEQQQQDQYAEVARRFVERTMNELNAFADDSEVPKICLVFDGDRLSAKRATHATRQAKKNLALRKARRQTANPRGPYFAAREHLRRKYAKQWVSFTPAIKGAIIHELNTRQDTRPYDRKFANEPVRIFIHEAPFEADPEVVYLCDSLGEGVQSAIMSRDGDLFAYQGTLDVP